MFDPANDLAWTGGITASTPAQPGPLVLGATVQRTAKFLGRTFSYGYRVTAHEPDRLVEMRVDRPFPMVIRYELDDDQDGATRVAIQTTGTPGGFFGLAAPLMTRQVRSASRPTCTGSGTAWKPDRPTARLARYAAAGPTDLMATAGVTVQVDRAETRTTAPSVMHRNGSGHWVSGLPPVSHTRKGPRSHQS
jgi:hypothetical protein